MEDHRHSERQPVLVQRDIALDDNTFEQLDRTDHNGHIVDISRSGVGIESNKPMEPGLVWFRDRIWGQHSGVLLWSKQVGTGYRSGIRFAPLPPDTEVSMKNQLAQPGAHGPLMDVQKIIALQLESIKQEPV